MPPAWAVNTVSAVRLKKGMLRPRKCWSSWPVVVTTSRAVTRWVMETMPCVGSLGCDDGECLAVTEAATPSLAPASTLLAPEPHAVILLLSNII